MYTYRVMYSIIKEELQRYIEIDEYVEDNEILEEVIAEQLIEDIYYGEDLSYEETDITITNIEPMERGYTNKELNNCTEDNKLC